MKGFLTVLILGLWLSPSESLPDLLAPFRNMFGMKGSSSQGQSHIKQLSSSKDPSAAHLYKHYGGGHGGHGGPPGGHGGHGGPEDDEPFPSNFGGFGGRPHSSNGGSEGPSPFGSGPFPPRASPYSRPSSSPSKPFSSAFSSGKPSRPVRQQPGGPGSPFGGSGSLGGSRPQSGYRPAPFYSQSNGPESQDEQSGPGSYSLSGGPGSHHQRGPPPSYHHGQGDSPSYPSGPGSYPGSGGPTSSSPQYQSGPGSYSGGSPYSGAPGGPYQGGSQFGPEGPSSDGPQSEGPGFAGYSSPFSPNNQEDDSPPPRRPSGSGGPSYRPRTRPFRSSSPSSRFPGGPSSPPQFFGGPSDYPEQFDGGSRGTREPQIITADDVSKYPPQINDDEPEGGPGGPGGGPGGPGGFGPPPRGSDFGFGGPGGGSSSPSSFPSSPFGGSGGPGGDDGPHYQDSRPRYPSGSGKAFAYSRPVSAAYQASAESVQYGKAMMMSASGKEESKVKSSPGAPQRKRSSKFPKQSKIQRLASPKDPNFRFMSPSSVSPVTAPFDSAPAASGHGHGGDETSSNGDRILYHVSGHQGPLSYRFGYDTGKGSYNRLFRFEEKDGKGLVKGKYGFYDKQGKLNVINYEAHPKHGFHAERGHAHGLY